MSYYQLNVIYNYVCLTFMSNYDFFLNARSAEALLHYPANTQSADALLRWGSHARSAEAFFHWPMNARSTEALCQHLTNLQSAWALVHLYTSGAQTHSFVTREFVFDNLTSLSPMVCRYTELESRLSQAILFWTFAPNYNAVEPNMYVCAYITGHTVVRVLGVW